MKTIDTLNPRIFRKICMSVGELPTSYMESMTYYEMVAWVCDYIKNNVITALNNHAEAIKEIQDWIETLDLQDEVDDKIDRMKESGDLAEIITQYLEIHGILAFDSVADMKAAENLIDGSFVETYGFYAAGDGGGAKYKVREVTNQDDVDEILLIALDDDDLVAELINDGDMSIKQGGAKEEADFDCSTIINTMLDEFNKVKVNSGTFLCHDILIKTAYELIGQDRNNSILKCNSSNGTIISNDATKTETGRIANLTIDGDNNSASYGIKLEYFTHSSCVENVSIKNCKVGCYVTKSWYAQYNNLDIHHCGRCLEINTTNGQVNALKFNNCWFRSATTDYGVYVKYVPTNTINALKFDTCTFEITSSHGLYIDSTENGTRNIIVTNCYFEGNTGNCIQGTGTNLEVSNSFFMPESISQTIIKSAFKSLIVKNCYEEANLIPSYSIDHSGTYIYVDGYNPQKETAFNFTAPKVVSFINNAWNNMINNQTFVDPRVYKKITYNANENLDQTFEFNEGAFDDGAPYKHTIRENSYASWDGSRMQIIQSFKGGSDVNVLTISGRTAPRLKISNTTTFVTPSGTTSNRPTANLQAGTLYFDTTVGKMMCYDGTSWIQL